MALGRFLLWHLANFRCGTWPIFVVELGRFLLWHLASFFDHINVETLLATPLQSFRPNRFHRIFRRGTQRTQGDDGQRNGQNHQQRHDENPPIQARVIGKAFKIASDDEIGNRDGYRKANQDDIDEFAVEQEQDVLDAGTLHTAQTDFLAAVLRLEKHQAKHTNQRNENGNQGEDRHQSGKFLLLLVLTAQFLVEEINVKTFAVGIG